MNNPAQGRIKLAHLIASKFRLNFMTCLAGLFDMKCQKCKNGQVERVFKTTGERLKNLFLPGKAYHCRNCGNHVYKHVFPFISWQFVFLFLSGIVLTLVI